MCLHKPFPAGSFTEASRVLKPDWTCPITLLHLLQKTPRAFCISNELVSAWLIKVLIVSINKLIELSQFGLWSSSWKWTLIKDKYSINCKYSAKKQKVHWLNSGDELKLGIQVEMNIHLLVIQGYKCKQTWCGNCHCAVYLHRLLLFLCDYKSWLLYWKLWTQLHRCSLPPTIWILIYYVEANCFLKIA